MDKPEEIPSSTEPVSLAGAEVRRHDERRAVQLKGLGLKALGLDEADLEGLPEGADDKKVLARFMKSQTIASNACVDTRGRYRDMSRRLEGNETNRSGVWFRLS